MHPAEPTAHHPAAGPELRALPPAAAGGSLFSGVDAWQAGLREHGLPLRCEPGQPQGAFKSHAVFARLCGNTVAELCVDAQRLAHRAAAAGGGTAGALQVLWQLAGRSRLRQAAHVAPLEPGQWALCDAGSDYLLDLEQGARCLLVLVPRAQCGAWLGALDALAALPLPAGGAAQVAKTMLVALLHADAALDVRSERALHDALLALVEHALRVELARRGLPARSRRQVDFAQVQAYVLDHLGDKALSVERVAAAFGMSRRNLYKVFAGAGVTPHMFIQDAKLDRAGALLRDPGWRDAPIMRIAEQCGFVDAAHFSRAFHARHGAAPNAWRSSAA